MAFERLRVICQSGLVSIRDFRTNALNIFAAHEVTAFAGALRGACYWALPAAAQPIWRGRGGGGGCLPCTAALPCPYLHPQMACDIFGKGMHAWRQHEALTSRLSAPTAN